MNSSGGQRLKTETAVRPPRSTRARVSIFIQGLALLALLGGCPPQQPKTLVASECDVTTAIPPGHYQGEFSRTVYGQLVGYQQLHETFSLDVEIDARGVPLDASNGEQRCVGFEENRAFTGVSLSVHVTRLEALANRLSIGGRVIAASGQSGAGAWTYVLNDDGTLTLTESVLIGIYHPRFPLYLDSEGSVVLARVSD